MAKRCGVSKKALELYQKHGLLLPVKTDAWTGYRYYAAEQSRTVERIRSLQAVGFTLAEIGEIQRRQDAAYLKDALTAKLTELNERMTTLERAAGLAQAMLSRC